MSTKIIYAPISDGLIFSFILAKFIKYFTFKGLHSKVERLISFSFFLLKKLGQVPFFLFSESIEKLKPLVGIKLSKVNKKKLKIKVIGKPEPCLPENQYKQSMLWLSGAVRLSKDRFFSVKLISELCAICFLNSGAALTKKTDFYKLAVAHKTTRNFRWGKKRRRPRPKPLLPVNKLKPIIVSSQILEIHKPT